MDSVIINGEQPKLLQLTVWFQAKYEKDTKVSIQVGTRAPLIHNDYMPSTRVYFYDIALRSQMPIIQVTYNALKVPLDLGEYQESVAASIRNEDVGVWFSYELMNETGKLEQKYWNVKESEDKIARGQGLTNFVRAESEFLTLFERDEEVEQIRAAEIQEEKIEKDISDEIIGLRKSKVEIKVIVVLIIVCLIAGFLFKALQTDSHTLVSSRPSKHLESKRKSEVGKKNKRKVKA